jgi:hypothetical protein
VKHNVKYKQAKQELKKFVAVNPHFEFEGSNRPKPRLLMVKSTQDHIELTIVYEEEYQRFYSWIRVFVTNPPFSRVDWIPYRLKSSVPRGFRSINGALRDAALRYDGYLAKQNRSVDRQLWVMSVLVHDMCEISMTGYDEDRLHVFFPKSGTWSNDYKFDTKNPNSYFDALENCVLQHSSDYYDLDAVDEDADMD